jgi:carbonic anhydrase
LENLKMNKTFLTALLSATALTVFAAAPFAAVADEAPAAHAHVQEQAQEQVEGQVKAQIEAHANAEHNAAAVQEAVAQDAATQAVAQETSATDHLQTSQPSAVTQVSTAAPMSVQPAPAWGYAPANGPHFWADLDGAFSACRDGQKQSPINIGQFSKTELPVLETAYQPSQMAVVNSGHAIALNYDPGSVLKVGDQSYELTAFGFRTPSEHYIDGAPYPMEMQMVHRGEDGAIAILSVMVEVGQHNPSLDQIWQNAPLAPGSNVPENVQVSALSLLPADRAYFTYEGSLTTPPCTENVQWYVLRSPVQMSESQLTAYQKLFPVNARFLQPLNGRVVSGN